MINRGHFIVVEGLEGAGKTSAIQTLKQVLTARGKTCISTREPGGTAMGEVIRGLIKNTIPDEPLDARAELLLFYAARVQLFEQVIRPALQGGIWVLADRFELSTFAYQGGGRQLDQSMIKALSTFCLKDFQPDLILFLDLPPKLGFERVHKRGPIDRIEQESMSFFNAVHASYQEQIKALPNVVCIDATQEMNTVQQAIRQQFESYLNKDAL